MPPHTEAGAATWTKSPPPRGIEQQPTDGTAVDETLRPGQSKFHWETMCLRIVCLFFPINDGV